MSSYSQKREHTVILAVTIGSILEWYEIYLYIYWSPIISQLFFNTQDSLLSLIHALLLFAIGFIARPIGGILFGRIGDLFGRKTSLILSIVTMVIPTFAMGLLPTYQKIGIWAPSILGLLRLIQALPSGGELPGAFCYLYESAPPNHRRYMTSWGAVGNQIGIIVSMLECYVLERFLSPETLISWGWRLSFIVGGLMALFGFYLRHQLHETPLYQDMEHHHHIVKLSILQVINEFKRKIAKGMAFCLLNSVGFYIISILFPVYFTRILNIQYGENLIISVTILLITTIPLPLIGILGDRWSNKTMLIISTIAIIALLYPIYSSINHGYLTTFALTGVAFILFFTFLTALIPYRFAALFPTPVRYTCVGLSYNIVDGIVGGFTPALALYFLHRTENQAYFYWIILVCALISLVAFFTIREEKEHLPDKTGHSP